MELTQHSLINQEALRNLPTGWAIRSIESVCLQVTSGGTPSRGNRDYWVNGTIPWLKTGELKDACVLDSDEKITPEGLKNSSAKLFPINTVLMAMYGDGRTITKLAILKREATTNQACCAMIANPRECHYLYLFYALQYHRGVFLSLATGSSQRNLSGQKIKQCGIFLPPLPTQRKIAAILSAYDDLIENNLRRIKILEEMAQNLYREWFVKFRFPGHQNARFTDSPLGPIPEGWEVKSLGNICDQAGGCIRTGPFGSQLHQADYQEDGTPVVMPKNIIHGRISEEGIARIGEDDLGRLSQHRLLEGDIVYGRRGDIGRQALVCPRETGWLCGTGCLRISLGNSSLDPVYLHHYLDQEDVISGITNQAVGATMPNLNTSILRNVSILCPAEPLLKQFSKIAFETLAAADLFFSKNVNLRRTRDLLLPKLISGEVDVSDLDIAIPEELDGPAEPFQDETLPATVAVRGMQMNLVAQAAEDPEAYEEEAPERRTAAVPVEEWDTDEVMAAFRQAARKTGITDRATLLKTVSAELGYERLGSRIKEVLQGRLRAAIRRKIIGTNGPEVWPETPTMDSYDRDTLIETLCSVMRMGTAYEREEVTRAVANHLGFRRLTDTVLAPIKSAINGAIRRGVLAYEGTMIWREQ